MICGLFYFCAAKPIAAVTEFVAQLQILELLDNVCDSARVFIYFSLKFVEDVFKVLIWPDHLHIVILGNLHGWL